MPVVMETKPSSPAESHGNGHTHIMNETKGAMATTGSKLELRGYQTEALEQIHSALDSGRNPMLCARTGSGKTEIAIRLVASMSESALPGKRPMVLFLVPGRVLLEQTRDRFRQNGLQAECEWPTSRVWPRDRIDPAQVMVCTPRTAWNRLRKGKLTPTPDLVIVDEAHHAYTNDKEGLTQTQLSELLIQLRSPRLGMTATPWSLSKTHRYDKLFDLMIDTPSYLDLVKDGYLAPLELVTPQSSALIHGGSAHDMKGEFTTAGIIESNDSQVYTERALKLLYQHQEAESKLPGEYVQTIIYAISVGHAIRLSNLLAERGVPVGLVISRKPKGEEEEIDSRVVIDRDQAINGFRAGKIRVLVNYAIVKEGFDAASAEVVMILRPTESLALYRQMTGRGSRVAQGKRAGTIIDCTDNWQRFGGPMSLDEFNLESRADRPGIGDAPVVSCNHIDSVDAEDSVYRCGQALGNARVQVCPVCGHKQGRLCATCRTFRRWAHYASGSHICNACVFDAEMVEANRRSADNNVGDLHRAALLLERMKTSPQGTMALRLDRDHTAWVMRRTYLNSENVEWGFGIQRQGKKLTDGTAPTEQTAGIALLHDIDTFLPVHGQQFSAAPRPAVGSQVQGMTAKQQRRNTRQPCAIHVSWNQRCLSCRASKAARPKLWHD